MARQIKVLTISLDIAKNKTGYRIKVSQFLDIEYNCGHYFGYIEDDKGTVVGSFRSRNAPPDALTISDVTTIFERNFT